MPRKKDCFSWKANFVLTRNSENHVCNSCSDAFVGTTRRTLRINTTRIIRIR